MPATRCFATRGDGGGDDRCRSYYIGTYIISGIWYTYADLWALVVLSSLSRLIEYTCTCCRSTTTTTRKQTAAGSFFFPSPPPPSSATRTARRQSIRVCAPDGPLAVTPRTRRIIIIIIYERSRRNYYGSLL